MTPKTITAADLVIPGDLLPGLLEGWCGPWQWSMDGRSWLNKSTPSASPSILRRVQCTRPEVHARLWAVLGADSCDSHGDDGAGRCEACGGDSSYFREAHNLDWLLTAYREGTLSPLECSAIWWASAVRVAAGLGPIVDAIDQETRDVYPGMGAAEALEHFESDAQIFRSYILIPLADGTVARLNRKTS